MMIPTGEAGPARYEPLGYVQFCDRLDSDPAFAKWFARLRADMDQVARASSTDQARLIALQNALIDLVNFLEPQQVRSSAKVRQRLAPGNPLPSPPPIPTPSSCGPIEDPPV
jgi:hypothetical protein